MAPKLNPWRSLQTFAIRTTRLATRRPQIQSAVLVTRRCFTHGTYNDNNNNNNTQPTVDGPGGKLPQVESAGERSDGISGYVPRPIAPFADNYVNAEAIAALEEEAAGNAIAKLYEDGLRYHMPESPAKHEQLQDRHHPVIHQVTRMLMRDGKLSKAEKVRTHNVFCW
jgi:small subunit ribosomal protein S7